MINENSISLKEVMCCCRMPYSRAYNLAGVHSCVDLRLNDTQA